MQSFIKTQIIDPLALSTLTFHESTTQLNTTISGATSNQHGENQPLVLPERYEFQGVLGKGSMGEVIRVRDTKLNRPLALKVLHAHLNRNDAERNRFIEEAQIEAQLQHPNIVTVYDTGVLESGQIFFTMREVQGVNWKTLLDARKTATDSRHEMIEHLHRVSEAIGFAHSKGVVHRDIKPANVMIGNHGEIWVVDWGIAHLFSNTKAAEMVTISGITPAPKSGPQIIGTPMYMSPEQALGVVNISPASDVYSLGAVLYQILTGRRPYKAKSMLELLKLVQKAKWTPFESIVDLGELPISLVKICTRALHRDPSFRYQHAQEFADELHDWLSGVQQKQLAQEETRQAEETISSSQQQILQIEQELEAITREISKLEVSAPIEIKSPLWSIETDLKTQLEQLNWQLIKGEILLQSALNHWPDYAPAIELLLQINMTRHRSQEKHGGLQLRRLELQMQKYLAALPAGPIKAEVTDYLEGVGRLTLDTSPTGAMVTLERYELQNRKLVPVSQGFIGHTPLEMKLPIGSYRLRIHADGYHETLYPVLIERQKHWDGVAPNETEPQHLWLPPLGVLKDTECYIPSGWLHMNGDPVVNESKPVTRTWVNGFIIDRFLVSNAEFLAMMNSEIQAGEDPQLVAELGPKLRVKNDIYNLIFRQREDGLFELQPDQEGDMWELDAPIVHLVHDSIVAYSQWKSRKEGVDYGLPTRHQLIKAGRGADLRAYVWGDHFDYCWANARHSKSKRGPSTRDEFLTDVSPYGVRDIIGNAGDSLSDPCESDSYYGFAGSWTNSGLACRLMRRSKLVKANSHSGFGFRLCRPIPDSEESS